MAWFLIKYMIPTRFLRAHENQQLILAFHVLAAKEQTIHLLQKQNSPLESKEATQCHQGFCCPAVCILAIHPFLSLDPQPGSLHPRVLLQTSCLKRLENSAKPNSLPSMSWQLLGLPTAWHWARKPTRRVWLRFAAFGQWHQLLLEQFWHS